MYSLRLPLTGAVAVLACLAPLAAGGPGARPETAAEKSLKALGQSRDLEVIDQPLDLAVNQLREQTGINFLIDQAAVPPVAAVAGLGGPGSSYGHLRLSVRSAGRPVREALAGALRAHNLTYAVVGDAVLITTPEKAADRQLEQPVSLDVEGVALKDLLQRLARETGANVTLDQRLVKEAQATLAAHLEVVPLEAAVELLADQAGLKAVRLSNVLYVTTEARADKLRKPLPPPAAPATGWQVWPDGTGGFRLTPAPAGNLLGGGGIAGGLGIAGGIGNLGVGGGLVGFAGIGGVAQPVPLTPPLPPKSAPAKPGTESRPPPPGKPSAGPAAPGTPAPEKKPEKKPASANRTPSKTPGSRRRARPAGRSWCG
jgi:hypothetical protein